MSSPLPTEPDRGPPTSAGFVWVDGRLQPEALPAVRADDRGFLFGDGIFETVRARDGVPVGLARHLERLRAGLHRLGIPATAVDPLPSAVDAVLEANRLRAGEARLRITVTRGPGAGLAPPEHPSPTVLVTAAALGAPLRSRRAGVRGRSVPRPAPELADLKALAWLVPVLAARAAAPDEAVLVGPGGHVLEAATANVFAVLGGVLVTPPADGRLLPGVARAVVLEIARAAGLAVEEAPITTASLAAADETFLTNALLPAAPLIALDERVLAGGGPVLRLVRGRFDATAGA